MWRECKFRAKGFGWDDIFFMKCFIRVCCIIKDERNFEVVVDGLIGYIKWGIGYFSEGLWLEALDFRNVKGFGRLQNLYIVLGIFLISKPST